MKSIFTACLLLCSSLAANAELWKQNAPDDVKWMKHSLWYSEGNRLDYKPVVTKPLTVETFAPKARTF